MKLSSFLVLLLVLFAVESFAQGKYQIVGHVKGLPDGLEISLMEDNGTVFSQIAKDTSSREGFYFSGTTKTNQSEHFKIYVMSEDFPSMTLDVWAAPNSTVKISGKNNLVKTWDVESDAREQKETNRFIKASLSNLEKIQTASLARRKLAARRSSANETEKLQLKKAMDSLSSLQDSLERKVFQEDLRLLQQMAVSDIWFNKLKGLAAHVRYDKRSTLREPVVQLFNRLSPQQKAGFPAQEIQNNLFPVTPVKAGEPMADADLYDMEGNSRKLQDYKGKYLLLDFWSIGCGPCMMAMPELKELSEKHKDNLTVISLSLDTQKEFWKKASEREKISWVNLSDGKGSTGIAAKYGVEGIPHYVMISPEGKVLGAWVGYEKGRLAEKLAEYTKN